MAGEFGQKLLQLTPDQVAKVIPVPNGGLIGYALKGPDGKNYQLALRPNLPDDLPPGQGPTPSPGG